MIDPFVYGGREPSIPVTLVTTANYSRYVKKLSDNQRHWIEQNGFVGKSGQLLAVPSDVGGIERVVYGVSDLESYYAISDLPGRLPAGTYSLDGSGVKARFESLAIGWGLGCYRFDRYKKQKEIDARLKLPNSSNHPRIQSIVAGVSRVRDLINTPAEDMMPQHLSSVVAELAQTFAGNFDEIVGDELLTENYPCIHTVGRASVNAPRLIELNWGDDKHPHVVLVGKGICFDSGGLDIKPAAGMRTMKKDMGGAAQVIGLAQLIMALELPIHLRVLIPAAENAISNNSYRPGDVITTRSGLTVEIDNTDAEGRLVLCDAISEACDSKPDLLIDFATLTGAARVAVGTEIAAFFCNDRQLAEEIRLAGDCVDDPAWELPLHAGYGALLDSHVADTLNSANTPFGGATTAALYLQKFVDKKISWAHFDIMAWNTRKRAGRPVGGEAMGVRAILEVLEQRFCRS